MNVTQEIETTSAMENTSGFAPLTSAERRRQSGERGSTLFEFAMVAVITLVLMFGMIDLARALYSYHFVTTAAREAARFASVRGALCSSAAVTPCPASDAGSPNDIQTFVNAITPQGIDATKVVANRAPATIPTMPVCVTQPYYPGCMFQVTVSYQFNWIFPLSFYNLTPVNFQAGTIQMSSVSEMVVSR